MMPPTSPATPPADTGGAQALYDELTDDLLYDPAIGYGTIMGHPCVRLAGRFVTCLERNGTGLILKLPADRVTALIADGTGVPFTANRTPMREWVTIPAADREVWEALIGEAVAFARAQVVP
ncbi:hypothetical protein ACQHIV_10815 [Kribbella sp. GL6]|uniref:hypothetical protein n=1 Tax=Kribbella sp. GL6 TaxID=3419765 RepID=UPI003CFD78B0